MSITRFSRDALPAVPWKNGGGITREIVCYPPGATTESFDWRMSIAQIAADGPFSVFPGVDRVIMLLEGAGVRLRGPQVDLDQPLQPFSFAGEAPIQAELIQGDCHDFNVMTRRAVCRAKVSVHREAATLDAAPNGLLMAVQGSWRVDHETFAPGQGLWWAHEPCAWPLMPSEPNAALVAVVIEPVTS